MLDDRPLPKFGTCAEVQQPSFGFQAQPRVSFREEWPPKSGFTYLDLSLKLLEAFVQSLEIDRSGPQVFLRELAQKSMGPGESVSWKPIEVPTSDTCSKQG